MSDDELFSLPYTYIHSGSIELAKYLGSGWVSTTDACDYLYRLGLDGTLPVKPTKSSEELATEAIKARLDRIVHQREP